MQKINFDEDFTTNDDFKRQSSFVFTTFYSSLRQKIDDPLNKRGGGAPKNQG